MEGHRPDPDPLLIAGLKEAGEKWVPETLELGVGGVGRRARGNLSKFASKGHRVSAGEPEGFQMRHLME